jgi:DNA-binding transcriptional ArsR family regulator
VAHHSIDADPDAMAARIAAAIGEPARARMLFCLLDSRARTSTELAMIAEVTPSTASVHLKRLQSARLVTVYAQGKHRYYRLEGAPVAAALEALSVLAGGTRGEVRPRTPAQLRTARTCYDHIAGRLGVALHDRFLALGWLATVAPGDVMYAVTGAGTHGFAALGIDLDAARARRRRFAYACLDWSERRPHLAGALGAAVLDAALRHRWITRELEGRAVTVTPRGAQDMRTRLGLVSML